MERQETPQATAQVHSVQDIAKHFNVSIRTVYNWIYKGELITFKIGNNIRITEASLQLFIEDSSKVLNRK